MTNKLRPCKYCGGKAELVKVGDNKEYFAYKCTDCNRYHVRHNEARQTPRGARRAWNRRVYEETN